MLPPSYRKLYGNVQAIKAYEAEVALSNGVGVGVRVEVVVCQVTAGSEIHV